MSVTDARAGAFVRRLLHCQHGMAALEFVLIAPALLMIAFGVIVYSLYFTAVLGVRQAAAEGARAAVAGLSTAERKTLAEARANQVIAGYGSLLTAGGKTAVPTASRSATGVFKVQVSFDMSGSPIMRYGALLPLPNSTIVADVLITNGSY